MLVALFVALIAASVVVAVKNWQEDPSQRTGPHLATWFVRVLVGGMWFQGMLWKLPLPASAGLQYWTEQMANRAAFAFHRQLATDLYLPNLHVLGPVIFFAEFTFAVALILRLGVRLVSSLAIIFVLHLWLGIYQAGEPAEWPWSYVFLAIVMFLFALYAAGRSLGLDAWLRRHVVAVRDGTGSSASCSMLRAESGVSRPRPHFIGTSGGVVCGELSLETGGAELTVSAKWAAIMPSAGIALSNRPALFYLPVLRAFANSHVCVRNAHMDEAIP